MIRCLNREVKLFYTYILFSPIYIEYFLLYPGDLISVGPIYWVFLIIFLPPDYQYRPNVGFGLVHLLADACLLAPCSVGSVQVARESGLRLSQRCVFFPQTFSTMTKCLWNVTLTSSIGAVFFTGVFLCGAAHSDALNSKWVWSDGGCASSRSCGGVHWWGGGGRRVKSQTNVYQNIRRRLAGFNLHSAADRAANRKPAGSSKARGETQELRFFGRCVFLSPLWHLCALCRGWPLTSEAPTLWEAIWLQHWLTRRPGKKSLPPLQPVRL